MLTEYIKAAMRNARYEILPDDKSYYGEIPGFEGVYANSKTLEDCRDELEEILEEWIFLKISRNLPLPVIDGLELAIKEAV
jgi:predicted RNase H-like HicB family nuclease